MNTKTTLECGSFRQIGDTVQAVRWSRLAELSDLPDWAKRLAPKIINQSPHGGGEQKLFFVLGQKSVIVEDGHWFFRDSRSAYGTLSNSEFWSQYEPLPMTTEKLIETATKPSSGRGWKKA